MAPLPMRFRAQWPPAPALQPCRVGGGTSRRNKRCKQRLRWRKKRQPPSERSTADPRSERSWMPLPEKAEIRSCCFAPPADRDEQRESKYCGQTGQTDRRHDYKAVAPGFRIVVITIQKYPIDKLTDLILACLNQA